MIMSLEFYAGRKVMITGGLGFLGSALAHHLVCLGANVLVVDNMLPGHGANPFNLEGIEHQVKVNYADIRDEDALRVLVRNCSVIFNLAAQTSHGDSMRIPLLDLDINARGNLVLLEACRQNAPDAVIVFIGTRALYGKARYLPVDESHPVTPLDIYSANRLVAEHYHRIYHRFYGMRTFIARLGNCYGPRAQMKHAGYGVLNWFIRLALEGGTIDVYGDGSQLRDYLYVDDAVRALLTIGAKPELCGEVFNVGSGHAVHFIDLVKAVLAAVGQGDYRLVPWPDSAAKVDVGDFVLDPSRLQRKTGWEPQVSLAEGLERTVAFYRAHREHYW